MMAAVLPPDARFGGLYVAPEEPSADDRVPPAGDPRWRADSKPLLRELKRRGPLHWGELFRLGRELGYPDTRVRQVLAWLEIAGDARAKPVDGRWVWYAVGLRAGRKKWVDPDAFREPTEALRASLDDAPSFSFDDLLV